MISNYNPELIKVDYKKQRPFPYRKTAFLIFCLTLAEVSFIMKVIKGNADIMRFISIILFTFLLLFAGCEENTDLPIEDAGQEIGICQYPEPVATEENAVLVFIIQHSLRIPDNRITVQLLPDGDIYRLYIDSQPMPDVPEMKHTQYHREKNLSQKDGEYLLSLLEKINWKSLEKEDPLGLDDEVWSMNYKKDDIDRNAELFCPYDESNADYISFVDVVKILLTQAGLDYNRLTNPDLYEPTINSKFRK